MEQVILRLVSVLTTLQSLLSKEISREKTQQLTSIPDFISNARCQTATAADFCKKLAVLTRADKGGHHASFKKDSQPKQGP
jgi:hypothetical protein